MSKCPNCNDCDQCDDNMAIVVCKMVGRTGGVRKTGSEYGSGTGRIWWGSVGCYGNETTIYDCQIEDQESKIKGCGNNFVGVKCS